MLKRLYESYVGETLYDYHSRKRIPKTVWVWHVACEEYLSVLGFSVPFQVFAYRSHAKGIDLNQKIFLMTLIKY